MIDANDQRPASSRWSRLKERAVRLRIRLRRRRATDHALTFMGLGIGAVAWLVIAETLVRYVLALLGPGAWFMAGFVSEVLRVIFVGGH